MNPEAPNPLNTVEFDDSPYSDTNKLRSDYNDNLKKQRANLEQEDTNSEGRSILTQLNNKKFAHEGHKKFNAFYKSLGYDERTDFIKLDPEEKEKIFVKWLEESSK